jgi:methionyl-tRNA formyltransferase
MKRVVFFGSIGLAKRCLEEIVMKEDVELLGVCCTQLTNTWREEESVHAFSLENGIPILSFEEVQSLSPDIGFSVRYDTIIPQRVVDSFKQGIFNIHGGIVPEYRGSYCDINALINNEKEYGVTLHYVSQGVDAGDVVAIKKLEIEESDTGFSLYKKSEQLCYEVLKENIKIIIDDQNDRIPQDDLIQKGHKCGVYYAKSTIARKLVDVESIKNSLNVIRAFDSPFHEPAYTVINDKKIYLRTNYGDHKE